MTAETSAVLLRSESKGSGFNANERPQQQMLSLPAQLGHMLYSTFYCLSLHDPSDYVNYLIQSRNIP